MVSFYFYQTWKLLNTLCVKRNDFLFHFLNFSFSVFLISCLPSFPFLLSSLPVLLSFFNGVKHKPSERKCTNQMHSIWWIVPNLVQFNYHTGKEVRELWQLRNAAVLFPRAPSPGLWSLTLCGSAQMESSPAWWS